MFSTAEKCGFIAFLSALGLALVDLHLTIIPLAGFVLLCAGAPFLPHCSFFLPVISRGHTGRKAVALTFDDGPDPGTTPELLRLLSRHNVPAAFFINSRKVEQYPELVKMILEQGHLIGNHTHSHDNLLMFRSESVIKQEIEKTQQVLRQFGVEPLAFRPPVGVTSPRLPRVLTELGMYTVNFSCRAGDRGNRSIHRLAERIMARVRPDAIVVLHDIQPRKGNTIADLIGQIDRLVQGLKGQGFEILPLTDLIGRPVMRRR